MANFSVEWLSRSCYEDATLNLEARKEFVGFTKEPNSPNSESLCPQITWPVHCAWTSFDGLFFSLQVVTVRFLTPRWGKKVTG